jgi:hypothetical protein
MHGSGLNPGDKIVAEEDDRRLKRRTRFLPNVGREFEIYEVKGDTDIGSDIRAGDVVGDVVIQGDENIIEVGPPIAPRTVEVNIERQRKKESGR